MADRNKPTVLVTGFGPFGPHTVNSSILAVKELASSDITEYVNLITEEIPVIYDFVKEEVPKLWKKYKPMLCVHVGVHGQTDTVLLERCARNDGYQSVPDIKQKFHETSCCIPGAPDIIQTPIDLDIVCKKAEKAGTPCEIRLSDDAGRYLCDFTYYTSLHHGDSPTVFVHLPPIEGPYSTHDMAETLKILILSMLDEIQQCKPVKQGIGKR